MKLLSKIIFLLTLYWIGADGPDRFSPENLAEKSKILNHFGSFYSSIQAIIDIGSLNSTIGNTTTYRNLISKTIEEVSKHFRENFSIIRGAALHYHKDRTTEHLLMNVGLLIENILSASSTIFIQSDRINTTRIKMMEASLNELHLHLVEHQTALSNDFLTFIGKLSINHPYAFCEAKTSSQIMLLHMVKNLVTLEAVAFSVLKLCYNEHRNSFPNSDDRTPFLETHYLAMVKRVQSYMNTASIVLTHTPNFIYSCDIRHYIHDQNYIELKGLVQPIFVSTRFLKSCEAANNYSNITGCSKYRSTIITGTARFAETMWTLYCDEENGTAPLSPIDEKPCYGRLSNCASYRESGEFCEDHTDSLKRYSWYKIDGTTFGREDSCPNGIKKKIQLIGNKSIYPCHCTCHAIGPESPVTQILSLVWNLSDVIENKVVTGIKLTRYKKIINLQLKQGTLIQEGQILPGSENWMPIQMIRDKVLKEEDIRDDKYRDFMFVILDEGTIFDFDDIIAESDYVVTGVKFDLVESQRVKILVRYTKFDWKTGMLDEKFTNRIMNWKPNRYELPITLRNPVLHLTTNLNMPDSTSHIHYVRLQESSRITDAGSTILPFFDAQPVETQPSVPLRGLGLYHRGSSKSGGLISMKLIGFHYNDPMEEAVTQLRNAEILERSKKINHLGSFDSFIRRSFQMISLDYEAQNVTDDRIFVTEGLRQLANNFSSKFHAINTVIIDNHLDNGPNILFQILKQHVTETIQKLLMIIEKPNGMHADIINDVKNTLRNIHIIMIKFQSYISTNFLTWIKELSTMNEYVFCDAKTSNHMMLFDLTKNLITLEMFGFYSHKVYYGQNDTLLENHKSYLERRYFLTVKNIHSYLKVTSKLLEDEANIIYSCDIKNFTNENYIELEGLVQLVFVHVYRLNSCETANRFFNVHSCSKYEKGSSLVLSQSQTYIPALFCDKDIVNVFLSLRNDVPCYGQLSGCTHQESQEVCRNPENSLRRYSWYKIDGMTFGNAQSCPNKTVDTFVIPAPPDDLPRNCHCTCHQNGPESPTTHILSLAWSSSDTEKNKVIVGIKFTRIEKIIHLQIKQGTLIEEGRILSGTEEWKSVSDVKKSVFDDNNIRIEKNRNITYFVFDENSIFDLDDVIADTNYVITGVHFHLLENQRLKLMSQVTKFNWTTGVLEVYQTHRIINPNVNDNEVPVSLVNPALHPSVLPNKPHSGNNVNHVKLKESSRKKDAGGTMLPFFDAQKVEGEPASPLSGIGLYHRGSSKSAGLISFKLIGLNYSKLIHE